MMNDQQIKERIQMISALLTDGHTQIMSKAVNTTSHIERKCPSLALFELNRCIKLVSQQVTRCRAMSVELEYLRQELSE